MTTIVGVDPGLSGAMAFLYASGEVACVDMPTLEIIRNGKRKRALDLAAVVGALAARVAVGRLRAIVEKVGAMPGQGVSSMFSFGRSVGQVEGVLAALLIPVSYATPQQWQKAMAVPKGAGGSRQRASQLLPAYADQWQLVKHHGRADAVLMALYERQRTA